MFVNFSEEVRHILKGAIREKDSLNHPYVGSEHLFLSILKESDLSDIFKKNKLTYKKFRNKLISLVGIGSKKNDFTLYTPMLKRILENVVIEAKEQRIKYINPEILVITILDEEDGIAYSVLKSLDIDIDKLYFDIKNKKNVKKERRKKLIIEDLGIDLTKMAKEKTLDPVIGRNLEIKKTFEILLRRKKNNPILIGPAGVGKTAIVEGLANLISSKDCPSYLRNKRIISLNIFFLVSGTKYRGEFEEKMKNVIKELEENPDIILFIDEVHTIVGAGGAEGAIDASNIFKPALARGKIRIIGATTIDEYKKFIEPDEALARRFQSVFIEEPDKSAVIKILLETKSLYEKYHNIKISDNLIKEIVELSDKYLTNRYEPDRSIDILDEVCAKVSIKESNEGKEKKSLEEKLKNIKQKKINAIKEDDFKKAYLLKLEENNLLNKASKIKVLKNKVTKKDIIDVIKSKANISVRIIDDKKNHFYDEIYNNLNKKFVGREKTIKTLIKSLKKKDILQNKKCYSILILGKEKSGKTYLSKSYLELLLKKNNIITIDLKEYKEYHTISKLLGTTAGYLGYDNKNNIFEKIRTNPNTGIIVENFESACMEVKNLFLKILEDSKIEDAKGKMIDFSNAIIIFNQIINKERRVGFNSSKTEDTYSSLESKVYQKVILEDLKFSDLENLVDLKIKEIKNKYDNINIKLDDDYKKELLNLLKSNKDSKFYNEIENNIESKVVEALIDEQKDITIKCNSDIKI